MHKHTPPFAVENVLCNNAAVVSHGGTNCLYYLKALSSLSQRLVFFFTIYYLKVNTSLFDESFCLHIYFQFVVDFWPSTTLFGVVRSLIKSQTIGLTFFENFDFGRLLAHGTHPFQVI